MSLLPHPSSFSHDRLRKVWRDHQHTRKPYENGLYYYFTRDGRHGLKVPSLARKFCLELHSSVQEPRTYLSEIDRVFDKIYGGVLVPRNLSEDVVSSLFPIQCAHYWESYA